MGPSTLQATGFDDVVEMARNTTAIHPRDQGGEESDNDETGKPPAVAKETKPNKNLVDVDAPSGPVSLFVWMKMG